MTFTKTVPTSSSLIIDIPSIHTDNWAAIAALIGQSHQAITSVTVSGVHQAGKTAVISAASTTTINAISSPATGALAWDTTLGVGKVYLGTWQQINMLPISRVEAYLTSDYTIPDTATSSANAVTVPWATEIKDTLSEYNTTDYTFTATATSGYYLVQSQISIVAADAVKVSTFISIRNSSGVEQYQVTWYSRKAVSTNEFPMVCSEMLYLPPTWTIRVRILHNHTSSITMKGGQDRTFIKIHRLS